MTNHKPERGKSVRTGKMGVSQYRTASCHPSPACTQPPWSLHHSVSRSPSNGNVSETMRNILGFGTTVPEYETFTRPPPRQQYSPPPTYSVLRGREDAGYRSPVPSTVRESGRGGSPRVNAPYPFQRSRVDKTSTRAREAKRTRVTVMPNGSPVVAPTRNIFPVLPRSIARPHPSGTTLRRRAATGRTRNCRRP